VRCGDGGGVKWVEIDRKGQDSKGLGQGVFTKRSQAATDASPMSPNVPFHGLELGMMKDVVEFRRLFRINFI
jgi:hypothetical protein